MSNEDTVEIKQLTDNAYYILVSLITEKHGYLIMQTLEELTEGKFSIGPASLYTNLKKLLSAGLICEKPSEKSNQKVYVITENGIDVLKKEIIQKKEMVSHAECALNGGGVNI